MEETVHEMWTIGTSRLNKESLTASEWWCHICTCLLCSVICEALVVWTAYLRMIGRQ